MWQDLSSIIPLSLGIMFCVSLFYKVVKKRESDRIRGEAWGKSSRCPSEKVLGHGEKSEILREKVYL